MEIKPVNPIQCGPLTIGDGRLTLIRLQCRALDAFDEHLVVGALRAADDLVLQIVKRSDFRIDFRYAADDGGAIHVGEIDDLRALLGVGHSGDDHVHALGLQRAD